jgi:hypothetical protein
MAGTPCEVVADIVQRYGRRSRLKLRHESEPEPWGNWLITPAAGYLESDGCGPWRWQDVEWVEVQPEGHELESVLTAIAVTKLPAEVVGDAVRIFCVG